MRRLSGGVLRRLRTARGDDERGFALVTVLGVMMVLALLAGVVLAASTSSAGFATARRASVQAQAAADAGVEALRAHLAKGDFVCSGSGTDPDFTFTVAYYLPSDAAPPVAPSVACPSGGSYAGGIPNRARLVSTGTAQNRGVLGHTGSDSATTAAVFSIQPQTLLTDTIFSDGPLTFLSGDTVTAQSGAATTKPGGPSNVYTNSGLSCTGSVTLGGAVRVQFGVGAGGASCIVGGDLWADGSVSLNQAVGGNVLGTGSVTTGARSVSGNVIANGQITLGAKPSGGTGCPGALPSANVCGSAYSLGACNTLLGLIPLSTGIKGDGSNGSSLRGSAYARCSVDFSGSGTSAVGGDVVSLDNTIAGGTPAGLGALLGVSDGMLSIGGAARAAALPSGLTSGAKCVGSASSASCPLKIPALAGPYATVPSGAITGQGSDGNLGVRGGASATVQAPGYRSLPYVGSAVSAWTASGWLRYAVPGVTASDSWCSTSGGALGNRINALLGGAHYPPGTRLVLDFSGCTSGVTVKDAVVINTLSNSGVRDLAFFLPYGLYDQGSLEVHGGDSALHSVYMVVPSNPGGAPGMLAQPIDVNDLGGTLSNILSNGGDLPNMLAHPSAYATWVKVDLPGSLPTVYKPICGALPSLSSTLGTVLGATGQTLGTLVGGLLGTSTGTTAGKAVDALNSYQQQALTAPSTTGLPLSGLLAALAQPNPNLSFGSVTTFDNTQFFAYTPCGLSLGSGSALTGQLFAGMTVLPQNLTVRQPALSAVIPGVVDLSDPSADPNPYSVQVTSRYDVTG